MSTPLHDLVIRTLATVEAKGLDAMMNLFADDAVLIDPHFPRARMQGKAAIAKGFAEAMSEMRSFGYPSSRHLSPRAVFSSTHW
jgi:ketosteroid isomerase-like protein